MGVVACRVACKQEHHLQEANEGIKALTVVPNEVKDKLATDLLPIARRNATYARQA
jgi:hypothetical protein